MLFFSFYLSLVIILNYIDFFFEKENIFVKTLPASVVIGTFEFMWLFLERSELLNPINKTVNENINDFDYNYDSLMRPYKSSKESFVLLSLFR